MERLLLSFDVQPESVQGLDVGPISYTIVYDPNRDVEAVSDFEQSLENRADARSERKQSSIIAKKFSNLGISPSLGLKKSKGASPTKGSLRSSISSRISETVELNVDSDFEDLSVKLKDQSSRQLSKESFLFQGRK